MDSNESSNEAWQQNSFIDKTFFSFCFVFALQQFCIENDKQIKSEEQQQQQRRQKLTRMMAKRNGWKEEKRMRERGREVENEKNTCRKQEFFSLSDWWCNGLWWLNCWMLHWKTHNSVSSCDASKYVTNCFCLIFN